MRRTCTRVCQSQSFQAAVDPPTVKTSTLLQSHQEERSIAVRPMVWGSAFWILLSRADRPKSETVIQESHHNDVVVAGEISVDSVVDHALVTPTGQNCILWRFAPARWTKPNYVITSIWPPPTTPARQDKTLYYQRGPRPLSPRLPPPELCPARSAFGRASLTLRVRPPDRRLPARPSGPTICVVSLINI